MILKHTLQKFKNKEVFDAKLEKLRNSLTFPPPYYLTHVNEIDRRAYIHHDESEKTQVSLLKQL